MLIQYLPPVRVDIPHEPGEWMEFRKPAGRVVREASSLVAAEGRRGVRDFGAEIVKAFATGDDDEKAVRRVQQLKKESQYDADNFDREALLRPAITKWSYVDPATGLPAPVTPEAIGQLDEETAAWAHEYVVALVRPRTPEADKSTPPATAPLD